MDLDNYTLMEADVQDIRFGPIDVYCQKDNENVVVFIKKLKSATAAEHESALSLTISRMILNHSNLLALLDYRNEPEQLLIEQKFEYPDSDITEQFSDIRPPKELALFLRDMLRGLVRLQTRDIEVGNLRPEFIYRKPSNKNYIIVDRMGQSSGLYESLRLFYVNDEPSYSPPEVFDKIAKTNRDLPLKTFKIDVFNVGMMAVSILAGKATSDAPYNKHTGTFDVALFEKTMSDLNGKYSEPSGHKLLWTFLRKYLLLVNPNDRKAPLDALDKFEIYHENLLNGKIDWEEVEFIPFSQKLLTDSDDDSVEGRLSEQIPVRDNDQNDMNMFKKTIDDDKNEFASDGSLRRVSANGMAVGHKFTFGNGSMHKVLLDQATRMSEEFQVEIMKANQAVHAQPQVPNMKKSDKSHQLTMVTIHKPILTQMKQQNEPSSNPVNNTKLIGQEKSTAALNLIKKDVAPVEKTNLKLTEEQNVISQPKHIIVRSGPTVQQETSQVVHVISKDVANLNLSYDRNSCGDQIRSSPHDQSNKGFTHNSFHAELQHQPQQHVPVIVSPPYAINLKDTAEKQLPLQNHQQVDKQTAFQKVNQTQTFIRNTDMVKPAPIYSANIFNTYPVVTGYTANPPNYQASSGRFNANIVIENGNSLPVRAPNTQFVNAYNQTIPQGYIHVLPVTQNPQVFTQGTQPTSRPTIRSQTPVIAKAQQSFDQVKSGSLTNENRSTSQIRQVQKFEPSFTNPSLHQSSITPITTSQRLNPPISPKGSMFPPDVNSQIKTLPANGRMSDKEQKPSVKDQRVQIQGKSTTIWVDAPKSPYIIK